MTIAAVDQPSPTRRRLTPEERPTRRPVSVRGPMARPARPAPMPRGLANEDRPGGPRAVVPAETNAVRACRVEPATCPPASWRLTDRGIALVLMLGAMIALAALTVIGLTAWQVTGPDYQITGGAQFSQR
jgi:hypothetical protein